MSLAELIRSMAAAGAPAEAIALAVEAVEGAQGAVESRRAADRDRKRRQRDKSRDSHGTVTGQSGDVTPPLPLSPSSPEPPSTTNPNPVPPIVPRRPAKTAVSEAFIETLWSAANADGRDRSGKPAVRRAVDAAFAAGATPEQIEADVRRHYADADRGERDSKGRTFAKGLHRRIEGGHWAGVRAVNPELAKPPDSAVLAHRLQRFRDTGEWKPSWGDRPNIEDAA